MFKNLTTWPKHLLLALVSNALLVVVLVLLLILPSLGINLPEIFFPVVSAIALLPLLISTFKALLKKEITIDSLASIALIVSLISKEWRSAAFINLMLSSARLFDIWNQRRAEAVIEHLLKLRPVNVKIQIGDTAKIVPVETIKIGDILVIEVGERIPVDGTVTSGQASLDEATITGESVPQTKKVGDKVYAATLVDAGSLLIKADKIAEDSSLAKIIDLVSEASSQKSPAVRYVTKFTHWYIAFTLITAVTTYLITGNMSLVLAILLVVCADDIAVSVPLAFTAAIAQAAQRGILIKSSDVLEGLAKIKLIVTDKTGTLTSGKPHIVEVHTFKDISSEKFLKFLGIAEQNSSHPISQPMLEYIAKHQIKFPMPSEFHEYPGEGMVVKHDQTKIVAGKIELLREHGIGISTDQQAKITQFENSGLSITALGVDHECWGIITFADTIKPSAHPAIAETKKQGVTNWVMLTGDNPRAANLVAQKLGIDQVITNLKPTDKLTQLKKLKAANQTGLTAMIGDGVNDAAALALADIGIAMGAVGSDVAVEAADVALMKDDLTKLPEAIALSRRTIQIVEESFIIWAVTNGIGLILVFMGILGPTGAATYNFVSDFLPIINALRVSLPAGKYKG